MGCGSIKLKAQESPLFKILKIHGNVKIDGRDAYFLQDVFGDSKRLVLDKNSEVGILTNRGDVVNLKSTFLRKGYSIPSLPRKIQSPKLTFGNGYQQLPAIDCITCPELQNSSILGDSIFVLWQENYEKKVSDVCIKNSLDSLLLEMTVSKNWIVLGVQSYWAHEQSLILELKHEYKDAYIVKKLPSDQEEVIRKVLGSIPEDQPDKSILMSAIMKLYNLKYDHIFKLYQWLRAGEKLTNNFYAEYVMESKNKYFKYDY